MNIPSYSVPVGQRQVELEVKRSKFLSFAAHAIDREQAEAFIRSLREQHPQSSHVCWAYIAGSPSSTIRSMSDDGEPSGTAGMPMLKVLEHSGLGDIVVAVVRYFGGTKLGTGGLQRAYSDAVAQVLIDLPTKIKVQRTVLTLTYDYSYDGHISRLLERYDLEDIQASYGQQVVLNIAIQNQAIETFKAEIMNITSGNLALSCSRSID